MKQQAVSEDYRPYGRGQPFLAIFGLLMATILLSEFIWGDLGSIHPVTALIMLGIGLGNVNAVRDRYLRPIVWFVLAASLTSLIMLVASWL